ncbi:MAG TPA: 50S ribosomal protein L4 [Nitrosopumilus sp.]|nr:50S ribosomal protein L4 [Nitrosopumilus sp.]
MKAITLSTSGSKEGEVELPIVFSTPFRRDLIHKVYTNLNTHQFQRQGTHPTAGMDNSADSLNPPTGHGQARIARMKGGGGGRQGEAGEVASIRGGRQAHPPNVDKVIHKKVNKKEKKLALCSAIAATASKKLVESRGHRVEKIESFPIIVSDEIESISNAKDMVKLLDALNLSQDIDRLKSRKARTGKSALRGRRKKIGRSILFVTKSSKELKKACGSFLGVEVRSVKDLSVLDLAPGSDPIRLTVYSKAALDEISKIKSPHLELMVKIK